VCGGGGLVEALSDLGFGGGSRNLGVCVWWSLAVHPELVTVNPLFHVAKATLRFLS